MCVCLCRCQWLLCYTSANCVTLCYTRCCSSEYDWRNTVTPCDSHKRQGLGTRKEKVVCMFQLLDSQCVVYAESPPSLNDLWRKRLSFSCQCNSESGLIMCRSMIRKQSLNIKISFHENCLIKKPLDQNSWSPSWSLLLQFTLSHQRTFLHSTLKVSTSTPGQSARQKRRCCLFHRRHFPSPCLILAAGCVTSALAALGARCPCVRAPEPELAANWDPGSGEVGGDAGQGAGWGVVDGNQLSAPPNLSNRVPSLKVSKLSQS